MIKTAHTKTLNTKISKNKKNQDKTNSVGGIGSSIGVGDSNKNLSIVVKSKNLTKSKRKSDFAKANSFEIDFLIFRAKKTFIYL